MAESTSETPVLGLLVSMTADSLDASSLDLETLLLVRIAALVAVDAPTVSYVLSLGTASEFGVDAEQVRSVLTAIAPIVGIARVASATHKLVEALEVAVPADRVDRDVLRDGARDWQQTPEWRSEDD